MYQNTSIGLCLTDRSVKDASCGIEGGFYFEIVELRSFQRIGYISLRLGDSAALYYLGHIGYRIHEKWRGRGYAMQACRLIIPLLHHLKLHSLVITTDTDNYASQKTCEKLGCIYEETVDVQSSFRYICSESPQKMRYVWLIPGEAQA